jgi:hypothetical protein
MFFYVGNATAVDAAVVWGREKERRKKKIVEGTKLAGIFVKRGDEREKINK